MKTCNTCNTFVDKVKSGLEDSICAYNVAQHLTEEEIEETFGIHAFTERRLHNPEHDYGCKGWSKRTPRTRNIKIKQTSVSSFEVTNNPIKD